MNSTQTISETFAMFFGTIDQKVCHCGETENLVPHGLDLWRCPAHKAEAEARYEAQRAEMARRQAEAFAIMETMD